MKFRQHCIATALVLGTSPVLAGDFQTLASTPVNNVPLTVGASSNAADRLLVDALGITRLSNDTASPDFQVLTSITYEAFQRVGTQRQFVANGTLTLVDFNYTPNVNFAGSTQPIGDLYDFVYRDSRDNALVLGTRLRLGLAGQSSNSEVNFAYRYGLQSGGASFSAAAAWLFTGNSDLRMYNAGRTASNSLTGASVFDADTVRFQTDLNLSEGNPYSGLFLLKTNARSYDEAARAIGFFQAGEEGQPRVGGTYGGFVPSFMGGSPADGVLPTMVADGTMVFDNLTPGIWFDPPMVNGFDIRLDGGGAFKLVKAPEGFNVLKILVDGVQVGEIGAGQSFAFGAGVSRFRIAGIDPLLDAQDPMLMHAFPLFLDFTTTPGTTMTWTPLAAAVPEPSAWALLVGGLALLAFAARGRRGDRA
jgi:hypothetical protein